MSHVDLDRYRAPAGFIPVRSHVEGIQLFAPAAPETLEERTRCASCGAAVGWSPDKQAVHCTYCGHTETAREGAVPEESTFTEAALSRSAQGWGTERVELACDGCGAVLSLDPGQLAAQCALCGSNHVKRRTTRADVHRPTHVLPFAIEDAGAVERAQAWLTRGFFRPKGLTQATRIENFSGVYLPYWLFDARVTADYRCQVGHTRIETDDEGNTHTVTDWSWRTGKIVLTANGVTIPGTDRLKGLDRVGTFPLQDLVPYTPDVLTGFAAQSHDVSLADGWERGRKTIRERAVVACKRDAGGDQQRNLSASIDLADERWTYGLLPVWVSTYSWGGKTWVVYVNGATGAVGGSRPVDWARVRLWAWILVTPGLFTAICLGIPTVPLMGMGLFVLAFGILLLIFGGIGAAYMYAQAAREESL